MRHDWTLLCAEVAYPPSGSIELRNVVSALKMSDPSREVAILPLDQPVWLVSQWPAEFEADKRIHSGVLQLLAPGGERVLREDKLEFDFGDTIVYRMIYRVPDMKFVGVGTYEFHVVLGEFASIGEWGRACLRIS